MRSLLFIVTLTFGAFASAQSSITGSVTDEADLPMVGVVATLGEATLLGTTSAKDGSFELRGIGTGRQVLHLRFIGYAPLDTTIDVVADEEFIYNFSMMPDPLTMRSAEITALRGGENSPFARSLVTKEELAKRNTGVDLPYLLELEPSVVVTSDAGTGIGYTGMRIRGTDATRTNITLNGVPFNDMESQGAFLVNLPDLASSAEDIEIQRGIGTSTNGPALSLIHISEPTRPY